MARQCAWCGGGDLTKEHALAKWIARKVVPPGTRMRYSQTRRAIGSPTQEHQRTTDLFDIEVRQACRSCNNGWMQGLENQAGPWLTLMMLGSPVMLTPTAQRIISAWAVKTAFMLLCAHRPPVIVHKDHRDWLFRNQDAPPGIGIWLAAYAGTVFGQYDIRHLKVHHQIQLAPQPLHLSRDAELVSFSIGEFVCQVWIPTDPHQQFSPILFPPEFEDFVVKVWPPDHIEQAWPPPATFDHADLLAFFRMSDERPRRMGRPLQPRSL